MKFQRLFNTFCLLFGAVCLGYLIGICVRGLTVNAQDGTSKNNNDNEKLIEKAYSRNPQITIKELKIGQEAHNFDERFVADDSWLKDFSFQVENTSGKPIVYLSISLNFPETKVSGNMMSYPVIFGNRPASKVPVFRKPLLLKPGDLLNVSLKDEYDVLAKFIETRHPISELNKVEMLRSGHF